MSWCKGKNWSQNVGVWVEEGVAVPSSQPVACCVPFKYVIISFMCTLTPQQTHTHTLEHSGKKSDMSCISVRVLLSVRVFGFWVIFMACTKCCWNTCRRLPPACRLVLLMRRHISGTPAAWRSILAGLSALCPKILTGHRRFEACSPKLLILLGFFRRHL